MCPTAQLVMMTVKASAQSPLAAAYMRSGNGKIYRVVAEALLQWQLILDIETSCVHPVKGIVRMLSLNLHCTTFIVQTHAFLVVMLAFDSFCSQPRVNMQGNLATAMISQHVQIFFKQTLTAVWIMPVQIHLSCSVCRDKYQICECSVHLMKISSLCWIWDA